MTARTAASARSSARSKEAHESRGRIAVLSVANMPLDLDVPRNYGTLDAVAAYEGPALPAPPDIVAHL